MRLDIPIGRVHGLPDSVQVRDLRSGKARRAIGWKLPSRGLQCPNAKTGTATKRVATPIILRLSLSVKYHETWA